APEPQEPAPRARRSPAPSSPAPRARPREKSSEVDDLLGALNGSGSNSGGARPAAAPVAAAPAGGDPLLPEKLTRQQILTVVKRNARSIQTCKEGDASGNVMVEMVIGRDGAVSSAKTTTAKFAGTPVGSCVEGKVRTFRFPQFRGDPMRIQIPFGL
ncbi:MAG: AgmX/PglI C-terminal domain-containing protein, partial [Myxococcales bacterium]|nr:AgmX/PglI C-terminal domain-containing protein [Myxococcales bacterium]